MISLNDVLENMGTCKKCPLSKNCNQVVVGKGPEKSSLFIVGETSDKEADIMGEPFVGLTGDLLTKLLSESGISRERVYLTNLIKCYNGKIDISKEIIDTCKGWLWSELLIVNPSIVVTLGKLPTQTLLKLKPSFKMQDVVGKEHSVGYMRAKIMPWYHPSYLLVRGADTHKRTIEFLIKIREMLNVK
jgi:uracil-DNA glycosylase family 4